jgi:molybdopterin biosynthesis enzyme MoaB
VVIFNRLAVGITTDGVGTAQIDVTPRSINTILYW